MERDCCSWFDNHVVIACWTFLFRAAVQSQPALSNLPNLTTVMSQSSSKNVPLSLDKSLTDIFVSLESVKPSEFNNNTDQKYYFLFFIRIQPMNYLQTSLLRLLHRPAGTNHCLWPLGRPRLSALLPGQSPFTARHCRGHCVHSEHVSAARIRRPVPGCRP